MTEELTKAASEKEQDRGVAVRNTREITGMSVELESHSPDSRWTHYDLTIYSPEPGEAMGMPVVQRDGLTHSEALAYLEGLETGARIQRERHAEVVSAVHAMFSDMDAGYSPARGDCAVDRLAKALSELEG